MDSRAEDVMPKGYDAHNITEPTVEETVDKILLGLRLRAVARRALKMGTVAAIAAGLLTGASIPAGSSAQAATAASSVATIEAPQPDPIPYRLPSRFGRGTWLDLGNGDLYVSAPLYMRANVRGWVPNPYTGVQVQELVNTRRGLRWVVRAYMNTNASGVGVTGLHVGYGVHRLRVVHRADYVSGLATGTTRTIVLRASEEPPFPYDID